MHNRLGRRIALSATVVAFLSMPAARAAASTVVLAGAGAGKVVGGTLFAKEQIKCSDIPGEEFSECSHSYSFASVTLNETPGPGSVFTGWSGVAACEGSTGPSCKFTATSQTVTATFAVAAEPPEVKIDPVASKPTAPCTTGITATAACFSGTVNPKGTDAKWRFEYRAVGGSTWSKTPTPDGDAGAGKIAVAVEATNEAALEPNTEYEVRLVAANAATIETSGVQIFHTLAIPPAVSTEKAWSISDTTATLVATVNPENSEVSECRFEYGTSTAYGQTAPCAPEPGSGGLTVQVTADVGGLSPETGYHFRVLAGNGVEASPGSEPGLTAVVGQDASFTTRATVVLPERHFELVSPLDTEGVFAEPWVAAADGERYAYVTQLPAPGAQEGNQPKYLASRRPDGSWSQRNVATPPAPPGTRAGDTTHPLFSSRDLSVAVFSTDLGLNADDHNGVVDIYREEAGGDVAWLSRDPLIEGPQTEPVQVEYIPSYVSPDGRVVLFESKRRLLPEDIADSGRPSLYEWDNGRLSLVGVPPGQSMGFTTGSKLGSLNNTPGHQETEDAVSPDGSRVVFESEDAFGDQRLYVRLDGERTVEASVHAPGAPPSSGPFNVSYWGADAEDNTVFFTSSSPLTPDSSAPDTNSLVGAYYGCNTNVCDLYAYDVDSGALRDLTPARGGGGVRRVLAVSDDGRRIYFTSTERLNQTGELTETAAEGERLQGAAGGPNVYLAESAGSEIKLAFIATLDPEELTTATEGSYTEGINNAQPFRQLAASPDGSVLAFADRLPVVPGRQTAGLPQIFVYETSRHELTCASCPADGSAPTALASIGTLSSNFVPTTPHLRNVSSDGSVFFTTATSLLAADVNDRIDLYEYRAGKQALISSGTGAQDVEFGDAAADGSSVFFSSTDSLLPGVPAGIRHIYVDRAGPPPPPAPTQAPPCAGGECRGPLTTPPSPQSVGSGVFQGTGNVVTRGVARASKAVGLTRAQKLSRALRACKKKPKKERRACRSQARRRYGKQARKSSRKSSHHNRRAAP